MILAQFEVVGDATSYFGIACGINSVVHCQKVSITVITVILGSHGAQGMMCTWSSGSSIFERYIGVVVTTSAKIVILLNSHVSISGVISINRIVKRSAAII